MSSPLRTVFWLLLIFAALICFAADEYEYTFTPTGYRFGQKTGTSMPEPMQASLPKNDQDWSYSIGQCTLNADWSYGCETKSVSANNTFNGYWTGSAFCMEPWEATTKDGKNACRRKKGEEQCQSPKKKDEFGNCTCPDGTVDGQGDYQGQCLSCGSPGQRGTIPPKSQIKNIPSGADMCMGGCKVSNVDFTASKITNNGSTVGYSIGSGSYDSTGSACNASDMDKDIKAGNDAGVEPSGPQDCPPGSRFGQVNGKNVCAKGNGQGEKKSEFCSKPENTFDAKCAEGGSEFCSTNPAAQACKPGTDRFCALNQARQGHPACKIGSTEHCAANPDHPSCTKGSDEFCTLNVNDPSCADKNAQKCAANPNSEECKKAESCLQNPNDPACKTTNDEYCKKFPNDPKCVKSDFKGACTSGFTCTGDAIQCAMARKQHEMACAMFDGKVEAYDAMKAQSEGDMKGEGGALFGREQKYNVATGVGIPGGKPILIPTAAELSAYIGQCPFVDLEIPVPSLLGATGGSMKLPLSIICEHGESIRSLLLFISSWSCMFMIWAFALRA